MFHFCAVAVGISGHTFVSTPKQPDKHQAVIRCMYKLLNFSLHILQLLCSVASFIVKMSGLYSQFIFWTIYWILLDYNGPLSFYDNDNLMTHVMYY